MHGIGPLPDGAHVSTGVLVILVIVLVLVFAAALLLIWRLYTDSARRADEALRMVEAERRRTADQQAALRRYEVAFASITGRGELGEQVLVETARSLAAEGFRIYRAGLWKPRTKPGGFEGIGVEGLAWLKEVKKETGMYVSTEVATAKHVYECLKAGIDVLWVGARTTANPFAVQEIADALKGVDIPVLVKNPVNPDLELWIGALERLNMAGLKKIGVIHRGFSAYVKSKYRNVPQWQLPIEIKRRFPDMLMICDPSHISGKREYIQEVSQQAMDLGFDGLIIESHICPEIALSDAAQQVTPTSLREILGKLIIRDIDSENIEYKENIDELRAQIDDIDNDILELLTRRMKV